MGRSRGPPVQFGELGGNVAEHVVDVLACSDQGREPPVVRQLAHDDQVVAQLAVGADDVGNAEVDVGREPPVQPNLVAAAGEPRLTSAEVGEAEVERLLALVDQTVHEEQRRAMGLDDGGVHGEMTGSAGRVTVATITPAVASVF